MTPLATTQQIRAVKGGHDAVMPSKRKPFSIPAKMGCQPSGRRDKLPLHGCPIPT
ncbi:MAG: hypothetical protein H8E20_15215 [Verrucomicrobia bacterium]|nr:hypothetical protein [Verrucomicrobiota bacterium]